MHLVLILLSTLIWLRGESKNSEDSSCNEAGVERVDPGDGSIGYIPYTAGKFVGAPLKYGKHYAFHQNLDQLLHHYVHKYKQWHPKGTFLDVGGRNGEFAALAKGYDYYILDRDPPKAEAEAKFKYYKCDLYDCNLKSCLVEIIWCNNVLEHLLEPHLALRTMAYLLKPGGLLILRTQWLWRYHANPSYGDYFRYSARGLEYLCIQAGLNPVNSGYHQLSKGPKKLTYGSTDLDTPPVPIPLNLLLPTFVVCYKPRLNERIVSFQEVQSLPVQQHPRFYLDFSMPMSERISSTTEEGGISATA
uniref:Methyltransferase type 11 domain-containing protein n=1 Tax=Aureoumbra lagunensis TaxID=44058 RepID=A0A7S3NQX1_9STRA|mmetsp:Transcript_18176/g.27427  ORF Transcript_18176/g.27427 Transcript_18176/m.27427 type:complete len:303 (+) Transcript_18176:59-967(+)